MWPFTKITKIALENKSYIVVCKPELRYKTMTITCTNAVENPKSLLWHSFCIDTMPTNFDCRMQTCACGHGRFCSQPEGHSCPPWREDGLQDWPEVSLGSRLHGEQLPAEFRSHEEVCGVQRGRSRGVYKCVFCVYNGESLCKHSWWKWGGRGLKIRTFMMGSTPPTFVIIIVDWSWTDVLAMHIS